MKPITKLGLVAALLGLAACESKDSLLTSGTGGSSGMAGTGAGPSGGAGVGGAPAGTAGTGGPSGAAGVGGMTTGSGGGRGGAAGGGNTAGGDGGVTCTFLGVTYPPGPIPSGDCNTCLCTATGQIACTANDCRDAGASGAGGTSTGQGGGPGGASGAGGMSTGQGGGPGGGSGAGGRACENPNFQCARNYLCIRYCGGPIESDDCCACEAPLFDNFQNRACSDGGTSVSCGMLNTLVDCDARPDCHPVFVDPGTCGCEGIGCCARFDRCAEGGQARCRPTTQFGCTIREPHCEGPPYVISYTPSCYEGCARAADCAP